ncbi:unnamed protein product [Phytomonas sp. Hart1]|nr:unnamed protein product [Phytomonas sp. Hart1]|eukprot:CCW71280.1 unnamed protein product [Phytomonas sp. isolate Hart1]
MKWYSHLLLRRLSAGKCGYSPSLRQSFLRHALLPMLRADPNWALSICCKATATLPIGLGGEIDDGEETHPDFQPRAVISSIGKEEIEMIKKDVEDTIKEDDIVVFIKGVPEAPVCSFSKRMIDVLEALGVEYTSFDVLVHPVLRSYVKEISEWPTIPQLFIKGEFAGGVDIIIKMAEQGDLQMLLDEKGIKHRNQIK